MKLICNKARLDEELNISLTIRELIELYVSVGASSRDSNEPTYKKLGFSYEEINENELSVYNNLQDILKQLGIEINYL